MSNDITSQFFHWMEANNISRKEASGLLGVDERSLSTYRSRGLPRKKQARASQLMREIPSSPAPAIEDANRISVVFTDEQYTLVEEAAGIVHCGTREFIQKAACDQAKKEIEKHKQATAQKYPALAKVAEPEPDLSSFQQKSNGTHSPGKP